MRKYLSISLFVGILALVGLAISRSHADEGGILTPKVEVAYRAGTTEEAPSEESTGATIIATLPDNVECECGARFEAKKQNSNEWIVLGLFAPIEEGDEQQQYQWTLTTNIFELDATYDIRVRLYDRFGTESPYGTTQFAMSPFQERACSDGVFTNLEKSKVGSGEAAAVIFAWDKLCKSQKEANKYKVYKNGQLVGETDQGANNFIYPGTNDGSTWKIEAYGEEPPNTDPGVIKTCEELITKLQTRGSGPGRPESYDNCQVQGSWLRAIVKFQAYRDDSGANPGGWLTRLVYGIGNNGVPYFNFVPGQFPVPGYPNNHFLNAYVNCRDEGQNGTNASGSSVDPWNQFPWICHNEWHQYVVNGPTYYTNRYWMNFDLNASGTGTGTSIWPVTTEFTF